MSKLLLATSAVLALALPFVANAGVLNCSILVDGTQVATCTTSATGSLAFSSTSASPLFSSIALDANGPPTLPAADLSSVTLDVSSASTFTGTHTLAVDIFQTGVSAPVGTTLESTATINGLINLPGPTTLSDFINGTTSTLGTTLRSATFPATFTGTVGPFFDVLSTALIADAQQYSIVFTAPNQSANDTIQVQSVVPQIPEPDSLGLLAMALLGFTLGWRYRRGRS